MRRQGKHEGPIVDIGRDDALGKPGQFTVAGRLESGRVGAPGDRRCAGRIGDDDRAR